MLIKFLRVDWNVLHSHSPAEIALIVADIARKPDGDLFVRRDAGMAVAPRNTVTLSISTTLLKASKSSKTPGEWNYTGQYKASLATVSENVARYGDTRYAPCIVGGSKTHLRTGYAGSSQYAMSIAILPRAPSVSWLVSSPHCQKML